jgi:AraC-like DNA-binding protein
MIKIEPSLHFNGFEKVGNWWNYKNIISPFSRIYLIPEGEAYVIIENKEYHLTPGKLFLIPKFTFHSYRCDKEMWHYYMCFFDEFVFFENIFDKFEFNNIVDVINGDEILFKRINNLNPEGKIKNPDPATYDNDKALYSFSKNLKQFSISEKIEIQGIIYLLLSRFIVRETQNCQLVVSRKRFCKLTAYIHQHLDEKITLNDLADLACLSPDYLSRQFLDVMGIRPMEYINRGRIERAQMLLLTTNLSIKQIAEKVGIFSNTYFSTLFKKQTLYTPEDYRKKHFELQN